MDYEVHVNGGEREVRPINLSLLPGEETIFEIKIVNHGPPAIVSLEASSPLIKAVRLRGEGHRVGAEETVPILIRMPQNAERIEGTISVISDGGTTELPLSLVLDDDGGFSGFNAGADEDAEDPDGDEDDETYRHGGAYGDGETGEGDGTYGDDGTDVGGRAYRGIDGDLDEEDGDESPEYVPCYRDAVSSEGNGDGGISRARAERQGRRGATARRQIGAGDRAQARGAVGLDEDEHRADYGDYDYRAGGCRPEDGSEEAPHGYSRTDERGYAAGYTGEAESAEGGGVEENYYSQEDSYLSPGLVAREQVVPGIMILALVIILVLTFYTRTLPQFPGALASSVLIVSLIIYGAATLLKA